MKKIFALTKKVSFTDLFYQLVDGKIVKRIDSLSDTFNQELPGKLVIFAHDYIGTRINQYGFYNKPELELVFSFLQPLREDFANSIALDIGGNIGNHALFFSKFFSTVYSYEANPVTFELLSHNSKLLNNIFVFNSGLGDKEGHFELNQNLGNMGASFIKDDSKTHSNKITVHVQRLDNIELENKKINFIKIDVEGMEANVIRGGIKTIEKHQPIIVFEQHLSEFKNGSTESIELLKEQGYGFCWIESSVFSKNKHFRRFKFIRNIVLGKPCGFHVVTSHDIPARNYDMLIAVPKRFQNRLSFS